MPKPRILVTGGCGYIGSHTIVDLIEAGFEVVSVDNLINSTEDALEGIREITGVAVHNIRQDLSDAEASFRRIWEYGPFAGIIHFAALKRVEESVRMPLRYLDNNTSSTLTVLRLMEKFAIPHLIFSSSCTVYGSPETLPVTEQTPLRKAENPYGASKQVGETLCEQFFTHSPGYSAIALRYFNPAGAHVSGRIGEAAAQPATNLVPVITETAYGLRDSLTVYGTDYPTRDGSCVRDFIHVSDLARAHTLALDYLLRRDNDTPYEIYNLGIGEGVTVLEAIRAFERVTGRPVRHTLGPRRPGDVAAIYADNRLIRERLGWSPQYDIDTIMATAWAWEQARRE
jgi:UDP-glucose 4-epimerase